MKSNQNPLRKDSLQTELRAEDIPFITPGDPTDQFLAKQDVLEMLKMSPRTLQEWRNKKIIDFTRVGGKIYYSLNSIFRAMRNGMQRVVTGVCISAGIADGVCDWMEMLG